MQDASKSLRIAKEETVLLQLYNANDYNSKRIIYFSITYKQNYRISKK